MISYLNPSYQQFLNSLNQIGDRMQTAQRQVSTGVRLANVSDDPDQVSVLLQVRAKLDSTQQVQANLSRVKTEVDSGEQALQTAVTLYERAQTLGAEGVTGTQNAQTRADVAAEVGGVLEQMVGLTSTAVEGRYIFSGDADQTKPYSVDLTQPNPVSTYQGSAATRVAQHPNGTTFQVSLTAQQVFDSADPTTNVFQSLVSLRAALLANDDVAIQTAVDGMSKVDQSLNTQLAQYGTIQNKISGANDFGSNLEVQLKSQISSLSDADMTQSILVLNQTQTQQQAALQAEGRIPRSTLFDFLA